METTLMTSSFKASFRKITPLRASTYEKTRKALEDELHDVKMQLDAMEQILEKLAIEIEGNLAVLNDIKQRVENEAVRAELHRAECIENATITSIYISSIEERIDSIQSALEERNNAFHNSSERNGTV